MKEVVSRGQRRLLVASNVSHDARKWQWLYRWLDENAVFLGRQMMEEHYQYVSTLKGSAITKDAFTTRVRYLAKTPGTKAVDVFLNLHGREDALKFADSWLPIDQLAERIANLGVGDKLRLLYSSACYGALHAPHFIEAGFKTASGARRVNTNGPFDYPTQMAKWREGHAYQSAVNAANNPVMLEIHDNLASLMGFDDTDSHKEIAGVKSLRITSTAK